MTDRPAVEDLRQRADEARRQYRRQFLARLPVTTVLALTGVSLYAACATFGMRWARPAGASGWEAAVWPVAVTATTMLAFYCRVRLVPEWYPSQAPGTATPGHYWPSRGGGRLPRRCRRRPWWLGDRGTTCPGCIRRSRGASGRGPMATPLTLRHPRPAAGATRRRIRPHNRRRCAAHGLLLGSQSVG